MAFLQTVGKSLLFTTKGSLEGMEMTVGFYYRSEKVEMETFAFGLDLWTKG